MIIPEVGVLNSQPSSTFSMTYAAVTPGVPVRLRIDTSCAVASSVTYGGVPMALLSEDDLTARVEHNYEIQNPPIGSRVITGTFSDDVFYRVQLLDGAWLT